MQQEMRKRFDVSLTLSKSHPPTTPNENFREDSDSTCGDFHLVRASKEGQVSPPNANTLTWESRPRSPLVMTLSDSCLMRAGVTCKTVVCCLKNNTFERQCGDRLTLVGTISRQAPDDKERNICSNYV